MTPNEFDRATARMPKLSDHNREAARRVLVDGERLTDVALVHGMPKSRLSRCVARVLNRWQSYRREPVAWVTVTLTVPVALAKRFKRMAREVRVAEPKRGPGRPVPEPEAPAPD